MQRHACWPGYLPTWALGVFVEPQDKRCVQVHAARAKGKPYTIVFVGVNGVGKSTSLSKVAYWLLQNDIKVGGPVHMRCAARPDKLSGHQQLHVRHLMGIMSAASSRLPDAVLISCAAACD